MNCAISRHGDSLPTPGSCQRVVGGIGNRTLPRACGKHLVISIGTPANLTCAPHTTAAGESPHACQREPHKPGWRRPDARGEAAEHRSRGRLARPIAGYHREAAPVVLHMSCAACTVRFRPRRRESMTSGRTEMRRPGYDTTSSAAAATPGGARNGIFTGPRQPLTASVLRLEDYGRHQTVFR